MQKFFILISIFVFLSSLVFSQDSLSTLQVSSEPSGTHIYLDDVISGSTPHVIPKISVGTHMLRLTRDGYEDWLTSIEIGLTDSNKVHAILNSVGGQIQVNSDVPNIPIYLDGKFVGRSPKLLKDIEFGTHYLELRKSRSLKKDEPIISFKDTIEITNNTVKIVDVILEKCWLTINSNPQNSDVQIDGESLGILPWIKKQFKAGSFDLEIKKDGFESADLNFNINPAEHKEMMVELIPMTYNKIFYRSLIFPGIGQIYADRKLSGYLFTISEIVSIGGAIYMNAQLSDASNIYSDKYNQYLNASTEDEALRLHNEVQDSYDKVEKYETYRNIFIGTAIAIWLVNIYDAHRLGNKIEENNKSLSTILKYSELYVWADRSEYAVGIKVTF